VSRQCGLAHDLSPTLQRLTTALLSLRHCKSLWRAGPVLGRLARSVGFTGKEQTIDERSKGCFRRGKY
jgi:hypothetical protein